MNQIPTTPPSGFRDFLPPACAARSRAVETISAVYRSFGFQQIATSAVEELAVLLGKGGGENEKLIFKLLKRGAQLDEAKAAGGELADAGLRFDLTLPLARYYSKYGSTLPHPFKSFHIGPVWRAERAQKGRFREFYQCDADIIGSDSIASEIEVISAILSAFAAVGLPGVEVVLNDRAYVYEALAAAGVAEDKRVAACVVIDKLDKVPREKVLAELELAVGAGPCAALQKTLLSEKPSRDFGTDKLAALEQIVSAVGSTRARLDPSLMRGFDYYTGPVFEFRHPGFKGSIGGGGRYDRLTEKFGGQSVPACGGSIGFERLMLILEEQGEAAQPGPDAVLLFESDDSRSAGLSLASELRRAGFNIDSFPGSGKLGKQLKYAVAKQARYLVIFKASAPAGMVTFQAANSPEERVIEASSVAQLLPRR